MNFFRKPFVIVDQIMQVKTPVSNLKMAADGYFRLPAVSFFEMSEHCNISP